ncbi:MAG: hypothetical protein F4X59_15045 [Holophagales bacterium]|nr:hypothetical protein [Holophagales bacterium]MYC11429.1 hypothetical protein [Holophagales bacterium]
MGYDGPITFYVNGIRHQEKDEEIGYDQVVDLAYPDGPRGPRYDYRVTWKDGPRNEEEGILKKDTSTKLVDGMKFDVNFTDNV